MEHMMAIVMAAGHGKRMKSNRPKVLHTVCGKPMIDRVVAAAQDATGNKPVAVSYTHLDVYKRQRLLLAQGKAALAGFMEIILPLLQR